MKVTIHQPDFLPWIGFFHRWAQSDIYLILDDVQLIDGGWHNRDKINAPNGVMWLTVPVIKKGKFKQVIKDAKIDNTQNWRRKHLNTIKLAYGKSINFAYYFDKLQEIYDKNHEYLLDLNIELLEFAATELGINVPKVFSSDYKIQTTETPRIVDLMLALGGTVMIAGTGCQNYLEVELFEKEKMSVVFQRIEDIKSMYHVKNIDLSVLDYFFTKDDA